MPQTIKQLQDIMIMDNSNEAQKEELIQSRAERLESLKRYEDLYDYAPIGYLTLTKNNKIVKANLATATILGVERSTLKDVFFDRFIAREELSAFNAMMERAFRSGKVECADVLLFPKCWCHLAALVSDDGQECRLTLTDISAIREAMADLESSEQRFRAMFEGHSAIMLIINPETGYILEANHAATEFYGWSVEELRKMRIQEVNTLTPEEIRIVREQFRSSEKNHFFSRHRRADQSIRNVEVYSSTIEIAGEARIYSIIHDVTARLRLETAAAFRITLLEETESHSIQQLLQATLDKAERHTDSSIGFFHIVGDDQKTLSLQAWSTNTLDKMCKAEGEGKHLSIEEAGVWADVLRKKKALIHNDYASLEGRKGMPEGHAVVLREVIVPIFRNEKAVAILGVGNKASNYDENDIEWLTILADAAWDVVAKKIAEEEHIILQAQKLSIEQLAMHDSLTGLPNRRLLSERISLTLAQCQRNNIRAALMIFDLDQFKPVNDTLGHAIGDALLQQVAARSQVTLLRSGDSIARIGGDEFVILLPQISEVSNAEAIAEKIRLAMYKPFDIEGHIINISCSIGIAVFPDHGRDEIRLMRHADEAMYLSKSRGRNCVTVYAESGR
ncbi:MAG: diguanylate cyclase [Chlorobiaceae bacterium]